MKMKRGVFNASFRWGTQLGAGLVFHPEKEVPFRNIFSGSPLGGDLEGALLARRQFAQEENMELITRYAEGAEIGPVAMVGVGLRGAGRLRLRRAFFGSLFVLIIRREGASRIAARGKGQGCEKDESVE